MKGLEYRCMALLDVSELELPNPFLLTPDSEDLMQHQADVSRERSLLYVASTRARDDLWVAWSGKPSRFLARVLPG